MQNILVSIRCQAFLSVPYDLLVDRYLCNPGLFAPRVSQQYRDEQRRRRSQFDRGTTAAEREIVYVRKFSPKRSSIDNNSTRHIPFSYPVGKFWYDEDETMAHGPRMS